jgi:hypothetical protein
MLQMALPTVSIGCVERMAATRAREEVKLTDQVYGASNKVPLIMLF